MNEQKHPYCPIHDEPLVVRTSKQGESKGKKFLGCPTFFETGCTYTEPIEKKKRFEKETQWLKYKNDFKDSGLGRRIWLILKLIILAPIYILGIGAAAVFAAYRAKYK